MNQITAIRPRARVSIRDLSCMAYVHGFTNWHLKAGDHAMSEVTAPDYFADAADKLAIGDHITVSGERFAAILVVTGIAPTRTVAMCGAVMP
jgi:hypothetical protein